MYLAITIMSININFLPYSFIECRFPEDISYGASGGTEFKTEIIEGDNGFEQRIVKWSQSRARYTISYSSKSPEQMKNIINFFNACHGRALGFRFKYWSDYSATKEYIGTIQNDISLQLNKMYSISDPNGLEQFVYNRMITKPVKDSVFLYTDNTHLQEGKDCTVDYTTGIVKIISIIPPGSKAYADFEFDTPVRFDTDFLNITLDYCQVSSWNGIHLVEIRL